MTRCVSWAGDGDVSIHGEPLKRVNFTDLLSGVVRSRPSKNIPPPYGKFLKALAEANIPESIIKNRTALNQYRAIKRDNEEAFVNEMSSTAGAHQDSDIRSKLRSMDWEAPPRFCYCKLYNIKIKSLKSFNHSVFFLQFLQEPQTVEKLKNNNAYA